MKTIDVRVLLHDEVDRALFVQQLITQTRGAGAPLGAVELVPAQPGDDDFGESVPAVDTLHTRPNVTWHGESRSA